MRAGRICQNANRVALAVALAAEATARGPRRAIAFIVGIPIGVRHHAICEACNASPTTACPASCVGSPLLPRHPQPQARRSRTAPTPNSPVAHPLAAILARRTHRLHGTAGPVRVLPKMPRTRIVRTAGSTRCCRSASLVTTSPRQADQHRLLQPHHRHPRRRRQVAPEDHMRRALVCAHRTQTNSKHVWWSATGGVTKRPRCKPSSEHLLTLRYGTITLGIGVII